MKVRHIKEGSRISLVIDRALYGKLEEFASSNNLSADVALAMVLQYYLADDRAQGVLEALSRHFNTQNREWFASRVREFIRDVSAEISQNFAETGVENSSPELRDLLLQLNQNPWLDQNAIAQIEVPVVDDQGPWLSPSDNPDDDEY